MIKHILIILLLILSSFTLKAQISVKGYVINETGDPIRFAHIQDISNQQNNTSTNEAGEFELHVPPGSYIFKVSAINYTTDEYELTIGSDTAELELVLIHTMNAYQDIVIYSGEDPGVRKMREVIKKRKQHAGYLQSLITNVYLKGNLKIIDFPKYFMGSEVTDSMIMDMGLDSNRQGIVYLLEQHTKYYYETPNKTFNEIQSVRTSGDPQGLGFAQMPPIINIYENNVNIMEGLNPRGIVSPAHSNAFYYYDFKLTESFYEGEKMISKIKVTPKRKFEPLFTGYVYVVENDWIFHSLELSIDRNAGIDMLDSLSLIQTYFNYENDKWIIKNQVIDPKLKIFGITIGGSFLTHYTHESINQKIDPKVFNSKLISIYDSTALDKDSTYWTENRKIPLTELEEKNFVKGDSLFKEISTQDSVLYSKAYYDYDALSLLATGLRIRKGPHIFKTNSLIDIIQFNNVEGLNLTLKPEFSTTFKNNLFFNIHSKIRYGLASKKPYGILSTSIRRTLNNNTDNYYKFSIEGGQYITDITQLMPISELYNTLTSLNGKNYLRFYDKEYIEGVWEHALGNGFRYKVTAHYEKRTPLENNTDYTWFKTSKDNIVQNNPSELPVFNAHNALSVKVQMDYQPGWKYIQYPRKLQVVRSNAPIFRLAYEKGIHGLFSSDVDYDKISIGMRASANMKLLGRLDVNAETGGFLNKRSVGNPDLFHIKGNQIWLANSYLNSFQLAGYYELSHDRMYAKAHTEWHLNGFLSNKIPLIKNLNWHFVIGNNTLFHNSNDFYTETSFGIENIGYNIYRFGRIDFVYGYNAQFKSSTYGFKIGFSGLLSGMNLSAE